MGEWDTTAGPPALPIAAGQRRTGGVVKTDELGRTGNSGLSHSA
uniref:Uncharacterized protein n=1 Tax=Plectus sambesii TaxID=2011161 RepID=A0A914V0Y1_9BILA